MFDSIFTAHDALNYVVTHVFLPVHWRRNDDLVKQDLLLARAAWAAAAAYTTHIGDTFKPQWLRIVKMLYNLQASVQSEHLNKGQVVSQLSSMQSGDILTFLIRSQRAVVTFRRQETCTLCEASEAPPSAAAVRNTGGSLICSYPGRVIEVPNEVFDDKHFREELANFLVRPGEVDSDLPSVPLDHPEYITGLLTGILRSVGRSVEVPRLTKRVRDEVGRWSDTSRRSPLWLAIRIAVQTSLDRSLPGGIPYKIYILFFMCHLAKHANDAKITGHLLHLISATILRRLSKLGSSAPKWLSDMTVATCAYLQDTLEVSAKKLAAKPPSLHWNPSELDLTKDTQLSLPRSGEYIRNALDNHDNNPIENPFHSNNPMRGTLADFLGSDETFFAKAYRTNPHIALVDVEQSVQHETDAWTSCVADVDVACIQLGVLMDAYLSGAHNTYGHNPEHLSIMFLTALELWVALDRLVVGKIPMLAEYSPEIQTQLLEWLLLRDTISLHRLSRVYQYISARHSKSRTGFSALPTEFTENSFPIRYYDTSSDLQDLRARIEGETIQKETELQRGAANPHAEGPKLHPLPSLSSHAKVVVFELQCPMLFRIWRCSTACLLYRFDEYGREPVDSKDKYSERPILLSDVPELQPYLTHHLREALPLSIQIHFAFFYPADPGSRGSRVVRYALEKPGLPGIELLKWQHSRSNIDWRLSLKFTYDTGDKGFDQYIRNTSHTPNAVLSVQDSCPTRYSLDEFISFGHLRSGSSLQWVNILRELRIRALNFGHSEIHFLLAEAASQVGPLDINTGEWIWHRELQDPSFCNVLLGELESLFLEVATRSFDDVAMNTISFLLTRVLASSPCESISERCVGLLRDVRRKSFEWVLELAYNLAKAPLNEERQQRLCDMAVACRSTFNVGPVTLRKILRSAEDVEALLSCASFIQATRQYYHSEGISTFGFDALRHSVSSPEFPNYVQLCLQRDRRLSLAVEDALKEAIPMDVSDRGIDFAIRDVWPGYQPGSQRWKSMQHPNSHQLECRTATIGNHHTPIVCINLLDGTLRVDDKPLGGLPRVIREHAIYKQMFGGRALVVGPSTLPGMDFATITTVFEHNVHFSYRNDDLVVRAQPQNTDVILELIPSQKLDGDLPTFLVEGHAHWLNLSTSTIEIRPLQRLWEQSPEHWCLKIGGLSGPYHMRKGDETLVDIQSSTWAMVSNRLACLELSENLIVTTTPLDSSPSPQLRAALPRYGFSFFVNVDGEFESSDFRGMVCDEDQCIDALFGLTHKLVLRSKHQVEGRLFPRRVLIPHGLFPISENYHILKGKSREPVTCHVYTVDTELGRLLGDPSLRSKLYLADLHANTSIDWNPDPLTGRTGAQEALCQLQSGGSRSVIGDGSYCSFLDDIQPWHWQHPQIDLASDEAQQRRNMSRNFDLARTVGLTRGARRAAYLFPPNNDMAAVEREPTSLLGEFGDKTHMLSASDLELENTAFAAATAIYHWSIGATDVTTISTWVAVWEDAMNGDTTASPSPYDSARWNPELPRIFSTKIHNILNEIEGTRWQFQLLFLSLTVMYCSSHPQAAFLSMLLAFVKEMEPRPGTLPSGNEKFKLLDGYRPIERTVRHRIHEFSNSDHLFGLDRNQLQRSIDSAVEQMVSAWPFETIMIPTLFLDPVLWDVESLLTSLQALFSSCYHNLRLKEKLIHILSLQRPSKRSAGAPRISRIPYAHDLPAPFLSYDTRPASSLLPTSSLSHVPKRTSWRVTLHELLHDRHAPELPARTRFSPGVSHESDRCSPPDIPTLNTLFSSHVLRMNESSAPFREKYISRLHASMRHIREESRVTPGTLRQGYPLDKLENYFKICKRSYSDALDTLKKKLAPTENPLEQALYRSVQWPRITANSLLGCLASTSPIKLSPSWKRCLISFALLLSDLQRARRLLQCALEGLEEDFFKELENVGCEGWDAEEHPDWLLIQIQGDFLIRRVQAEIAMEMVSPKSGGNTVMQVNMGEGKSSVIIPITAAALADGSQLVRVVVPKALTTQMFDILVDRLGGLTNRPIYYLPFSRSNDKKRNTGNLRIHHLHKLMSQCMAEHGILLVHPEHVLSLKLTSIEKLLPNAKLVVDPLAKTQKSFYEHVMAALSLKSLTEDSYVANMIGWLSNPITHLDEVGFDAIRATSSGKSKLFNLQRFLHSHCRDILDESDEILHPRLQLIYTVGLQQHMEGYPERWTITQQILTFVKHHARSLSKDLPDSIEYEQGPPGSFPHVRILRTSDAGRWLISSIVEDVMTGRLHNFRFQHLRQPLQDAIQSFISSEKIPLDTAKKVQDYANHSQQSGLWDGLLLLRGLLACNLLLFALAERRWRVDYGLSSDTMLSVPYRAKDVPAPNTQFGHPDITILFTCLSYYYTGLKDDQLRFAFQLLLKQDNPAMEYALWIQACGSEGVPDALRKLGEVNAGSSEQWDKIVFPLFSSNQAVIDLFLSRFVFPKAAKEFPWKLVGSSWDLTEERERLITGFSGTNDTRYLLPLTVSQHDLPHQQGTNAKVLAYLLRPENQAYRLMADEKGDRLTTLQFLGLVASESQHPEREIRVLLDVGAQILDLSNHELAEAWLNLSSGTAGAIYFNEKDELMVLTRNGRSQVLKSSPLAQQLDRCIVYLDHAHTRGTDLKLPRGFRAAVTLGPKVTKDHLVQGCMRMRKLGHGHSVMFFAPLEVDRSIRSLASKEDPTIPVTTADILCWAIHETWTDIEQRAPYWANQGIGHKSRHDAWARFCNGTLTPEKFADAWLQPESRSLAELYAPCDAMTAQSLDSSRLEEIYQRCRDLGVSISSIRDTQMDEHVERQVNREIERERELELPPRADPAEHSLHPDVVTFVNTGVILPYFPGSPFRPVFTTLERSSAATSQAHFWSPSILATEDFCNTIEPGSTHGRLDQYLRPVQWVLSGGRDGNRVLVLLSPFEADRLMPYIRESKHVHLHVYAPRTTEQMKPSDDLNFYTIPPLPADWTPPLDLIDQLNVFAGQLYLRDYDSYRSLSNFFGLNKQAQLDKSVRRNLFMLRSQEEIESSLSNSLLAPVMMLLAIRTRGRPFAHTHMGRILQGESLTESDFVRTTSIGPG